MFKQKNKIDKHICIKDEVNIKRVRYKAGRAAFPLRMGMVKDVMSMEKGSIASTKHHQTFAYVAEEVTGFLRLSCYHGPLCKERRS